MQPFHRLIALIFALPLLVSVLTGLTYRVGRYWFGMSNETGAIVRGIHEGKYLGEMLVPVYVLVIGLGSLTLLITGMTMLSRPLPPLPPSDRLTQVKRHRWLAAIVALPLLVTTLSGVGFRLTQSWLGWSKPEAKWLLDLHQGSWLGSDLRAYYVLVIGLSVLALLATGVSLLIPIRNQAPLNPPRKQS